MADAAGLIRQLGAEDRAVLRALGPNGEYHQSETNLMSWCMSHGIFSRLEECGSEGWATPTDFGREVLAKLKGARDRDATSAETRNVDCVAPAVGSQPGRREDGGSPK